MDKAVFDSMSDELQSDEDLETHIGKMGTKFFEKDEDNMGSSGLWSDGKVYYAFSPSVGKQRLFLYILTHSTN